MRVDRASTVTFSGEKDGRRSYENTIHSSHRDAQLPTIVRRNTINDFSGKKNAHFFEPHISFARTPCLN
jgi:hypothetical protein